MKYVVINSSSEESIRTLKGSPKQVIRQVLDVIDHTLGVPATHVYCTFSAGSLRIQLYLDVRTDYYLSELSIVTLNDSQDRIQLASDTFENSISMRDPEHEYPTRKFLDLIENLSY